MSSTKPRELFFLIDCNAFFVSCERVFNPKLWKQPVVVLSNNDGCIIARSKEAKQLGIPMGAPLYQYQELLIRHRVFVYSSNYTLYGDLSHRVMQVLEQFSPKIEIYSIDEAFLLIETEDHLNLAKEIRKRVFRWTGIPVSVGIGPTKTLAKLANHIAKKNERYKGVYCLKDPHHINQMLASFSLGKVWGIGRRLEKRLNEKNIFTPLQLKCAPDSWIQKSFSVTLLKTVLELRGNSCLHLEEIDTPRKSITRSRSFGKTVTALPQLEEAIASYAAQAAKTLRKEGLVTSHLTAFLTTSPFIQTPYSNSMTLSLDEPTAYTPLLISKAKQCIQKINRKGYQYKKVGVIFHDLSPHTCYQRDLFSPFSPAHIDAMRTLDQIHYKYGNRSLSFAAEGIHKPWQMLRSFTSARFTTNWKELLTIQQSGT